MFQENFQSSTGFPFWPWPTSCDSVCICDRVCVNVHHRRWAAVDAPVWAAPSRAGVPRDCPWCALFFSHHWPVLVHRAGGKQWTAASFLQPDLTLTLLHSKMKIDNFPQGFFPSLEMSRRMLHCCTAPYQPVRRKDRRHLHAVFKTAISVEQWCLKSVNQVWTGGSVGRRRNCCTDVPGNVVCW